MQWRLGIKRNIKIEWMVRTFFNSNYLPILSLDMSVIIRPDESSILGDSLFDFTQPGTLKTFVVDIDDAMWSGNTAILVHQDFKEIIKDVVTMWILNNLKQKVDWNQTQQFTSTFFHMNKATRTKTKQYEQVAEYSWMRSHFQAYHQSQKVRHVMHGMIRNQEPFSFWHCLCLASTKWSYSPTNAHIVYKSLNSFDGVIMQGFSRTYELIRSNTQAEVPNQRSNAAVDPWPWNSLTGWDCSKPIING